MSYKNRKKQSRLFKQTVAFESYLMRSFIGKPNTLPNIVKKFEKVTVGFALSDDEKTVTFNITGKHRNRVNAVTDLFIMRYNRVADITSKILKSKNQY